MANTGFFHHIGTFLIFAASILLLVTTISAPVINNIALLKVDLSGGDSSLSFGTFGYCITQPGDDVCSGKHIGYNPAEILEGAGIEEFNRASTDSTKALTRVMILHPVACGVSFIAFLLALGSGFCGAIFASVVAMLAFLISLVAVICDFVSFGIIKRHVNNEDSGNKANFSVAIWLILVAMLCLFIGTIIVLLTCCSSRMHRQKRGSKHAEGGYVTGHRTKRHFWQRGNRY
ncbi:uncharacterized protein BP5553_00330 [Venustampulla echinocandica]|uniref:Pali-domain-containing protein n=1 Tax=Venustampulla echinocandica TaxID=2656787 RepID=A0A370TXV5_9HELO|nr:uncharacterized protein BP5553_00330 [Venustampulla echinocandica]RDL40351.1 hypothetical protein BP5553_00330 [Venustampulla echinocandica]